MVSQTMFRVTTILYWCEALLKEAEVIKDNTLKNEKKYKLNVHVNTRNTVGNIT
jgi:uncharacterized protein (DUF2344 family)